MSEVRSSQALTENALSNSSLKKTGKPAVLTVHGQAEVVVQDAEAYQRLLDLAANAAAIVGIQRGLQGMYAGTGDHAEDAFRSLEHELDIPATDV
jgi:hypothetical protein